MSDRAITSNSLAVLWLAFGRRIAVAAGALAALVSLIAHAPLDVAALRGALTLVAVRITVRIGRALLVHAGGPSPATRGGKPTA